MKGRTEDAASGTAVNAQLCPEPEISKLAGLEERLKEGQNWGRGVLIEPVLVSVQEMSGILHT